MTERKVGALPPGVAQVQVVGHSHGGESTKPEMLQERIFPPFLDPLWARHAYRRAAIPTPAASGTEKATQQLQVELFSVLPDDRRGLLEAQALAASRCLEI